MKYIFAVLLLFFNMLFCSLQGGLALSKVLQPFIEPDLQENIGRELSLDEQYKDKHKNYRISPFFGIYKNGFLGKQIFPVIDRAEIKDFALSPDSSWIVALQEDLDAFYVHSYLWIHDRSNKEYAYLSLQDDCEYGLFAIANRGEYVALAKQNKAQKELLLYKKVLHKFLPFHTIPLSDAKITKIGFLEQGCILAWTTKNNKFNSLSLHTLLEKQ